MKLSFIDAITFDSIGAWPFGKGTKLRHVLYEFGYRDRALPRREDFNSSVRRLGEAGLVTAVPGHLKVTRLGKQLARKYRKPSRGIIEATVLLGRAWDGLELESLNPGFQFSLSHDEWREAVSDGVGS